MPSYPFHPLRAGRVAACCLAGSLAACAVPSWAQVVQPASVNQQGYSFLLGFGRLNHQYQEFPSSQPVHSRVRTSTPILSTGAVYAVTPELMFSLASEVTFFADTAKETWTATSDAFNGRTLTNRVLQTNKASFSNSDTQVLGHYRLGGEAFLLGGPSVRTQSFRRHSFALGADAAVSLPSVATVEESSTEVLMHLGAGLETGGVKGHSSHYSLKALIGLPMVRRVENTNHPGVTFNSTRGYDLSLEGRYSMAVHPGVHLGLWGRWNMARRSAQTQTITDSSGSTTLELPRNEQTSLGYGIELLWKL